MMGMNRRNNSRYKICHWIDAIQALPQINLTPTNTKEQLMYVNPNFPTKKAFKDAVKEGKHIEIYQPNNMFGIVPPTNGTVTIEGPHAPKPHNWYARVTITNGKITGVK